MKKFVLLFISIIILSCSIDDEISNSEWVFIACEGNFGASNGSVYMVNSFGEMLLPVSSSPTFILVIKI